MPVNVTLNGGWINVRDGQQIVTVDATVGSNHHQVTFLKSDLDRIPTLAAKQKFVAQQLKAADAQASGITSFPTSDLSITGTISI
jgi:hypothetical protein